MHLWALPLMHIVVTCCQGKIKWLSTRQPPIHNQNSKTQCDDDCRKPNAHHMQRVQICYTCNQNQIQGVLSMESFLQELIKFKDLCMIVQNQYLEFLSNGIQGWEEGYSYSVLQRNIFNMTLNPGPITSMCHVPSVFHHVTAFLLWV